MMEVNFMAVILAAVSNMVLGFLWYGPIFGKKWTELEGWTKADMEVGKKTMNQTYALAFVGAFVTAYVLANVINFMGSTDVVSGVMAGFWSWLGFSAPVLMNEVLFGRKKWETFYINVSYYLVALVVMGGIIAGMGV